MNEGTRIYDLAYKIFPICRSITGAGVRETLAILKEYVGNEELFKIHSIPSGTEVFDWKVPKEWLIHDAYIEDESGNHVIDFKENNLHVMGYSVPVDKWVTLKELRHHIFTLPDQPDVIPYVTSYYKERFGFCMSENQLRSLSGGKYHMVIDSDLFDGFLDYGEIVILGDTSEEIFFSTYICHPSMANNECSGPALSAELARYVLSLKKRRYTYRFVYIPETIGAVAYLATKNHLKYMKEKVICGFNLTCVGDDRDYSMVQTRYADTLADKVLKNILHFHCQDNYSVYSFLDRGSDERQYCAPGVDLPVAGFSRSLFHKYPEYHTSADNMGMVSPSAFQGSFMVMKKVIDAVEHNYFYKVKVLCEPQLGKRGMYPTFSKKYSSDSVLTMSNFIAYADGKNDLFDISNIINTSVDELIPIIKKLTEHKLIEKGE